MRIILETVNNGVISIIIDRDFNYTNLAIIKNQTEFIYIDRIKKSSKEIREKVNLSIKEFDVRLITELDSLFANTQTLQRIHYDNEIEKLKLKDNCGINKEDKEERVLRFTTFNKIYN